VWSRPNKERVERLIAEGRMTPFGLAVIEAAQADGSWSALDDVEALVVPPDLAEALDSQPEARKRFEAFSDSVKKTSLYFVTSAKRPETRARRIAETVGLAARGLRVIDYSAAERARILGEEPGAPADTSPDAEDTAAG